MVVCYTILPTRRAPWVWWCLNPARVGEGTMISPVWCVSLDQARQGKSTRLD